MMLMQALTTLLASAEPVLPFDGGMDRSFWMPPRASTVAGDVDIVFDVITWISIFFFLVVVIAMGIFVWRYRRHSHDATPTRVGPTHNTPLEVTWTVIPLILVILIFYVGMQGFLNLRVAPADAYQVDVVARKWSWDFSHPDYGALETNILRVPVNRPVVLTMSSEDVLHSFYVPAFRVKMDVVPGRFTKVWFEAHTPGEYDLYCTEYCGTGHSEMLGKVLVYAEEDFEPAMQDAADPFGDVAEGQEYTVVGTTFYRRCATCHSLDGTTVTGPSFRQTHELWGQPRVMADGSEVVIDENYIRESLLYPQRHLVAGYGGVMPSFQGALDEREILAIARFIQRLDEFNESGEWIPREGVVEDAPAVEGPAEE